MANIVWILGAGFSKPLGGPLLGDLFRLDAVRWLEATFQIRNGVLQRLRGAHRLYHHGRRFRDGRLESWDTHLRGELLWEDAEQFIDFLETAEQRGAKSAAGRILQRIISSYMEAEFAPRPYLNNAAAAGRRLLAAECSAFLASADPSTERWRPYANWAARLRSDDVVVTFNYDRVLEQIATTMPDKFEFVSPGQTSGPIKGVRVLHLHGCVDWELRTDDTIHRTDKPDWPLRCEDDELAIYAPGPRKMLASKQLADLWTEALTAISTAKAVVFMGYRFPPSDAESREKLLGAISKNKESFLAMHIVLGPNTHHHDVLRLQQLLQYAARLGGRVSEPRGPNDRLFALVPQPLWAEDFLSIASNEMVLNPFAWGFRPTP